MATIDAQILVRQDTEAQWASVNPVLGAGEPGYETDTGRVKWGDGTTAWNSLGYTSAEATTLGEIIEGLTAKATPVDADTLPLTDTEAANAPKKITFANLWIWIQAKIFGATPKTTPIDADSIAGIDSAASNVVTRWTFANIWIWIQSKIHGAANKDTLVDADKVAIVDTEASNVTKTTTWANIKAKIKALLPATIEAGTATTTPLDTSIVPGVKADHSLLYYTWANIFAAIWTRLGGLIAGGANKATIVDADKTSLSDSADTNATKYATAANWFTYISGKLYAWIVALTAKDTPADADVLHYADTVGAASKKITWANFKTALITAFKATAASLVTGTSDVLFPTVKQLKDATALADFFLTKRTKMPDGATEVEYQDEFATVYGWAKNSGSGTVGVSGGRLTVEAACNGIYKSIAGCLGKKLLIKMNAPLGGTFVFAVGGNQGATVVLPASSVDAVFIVQLPAYAGSNILGISVTGVAFSIDAYWIGDYSYLPGSLSEEAARIANQLGDTPGVGAAASGAFTINSTQPADNSKVTISGKVYTFLASGSTPTTEGDVVKSSVSAISTLQRLGIAINRQQPGTYDGSVYKIAAPHPLVYVPNPTSAGAALPLIAGQATGAGAVQTYVNSVGILGNTIAISAEAGANLTASGTTLAGGVDDAGAKAKAQLGPAIGAGATPGAMPTRTSTSIIGYRGVADCASGAQVTLPAGGTWMFRVATYGATYNSVMAGTAAGGLMSGTASANLRMFYERIA